MIVGFEKGAAPVGVAEAKAWLRLGAGHDDAVVAGLVRAATDLCEAFIGQMLIARTVTEEWPAEPGWVSLAKRPVLAVDAVAMVVDGVATPLGEGDWSARVDRDGSARLAVHAAVAGAHVRATYRAGLAGEPNGVPEAIRQGLSRMIQHLHGARDAPDAAPPAIVAALWQPWRRIGLGGSGAR